MLLSHSHLENILHHVYWTPLSLRLCQCYHSPIGFQIWCMALLTPSASAFTSIDVVQRCDSTFAASVQARSRHCSLLKPPVVHPLPIASCWPFANILQDCPVDHCNDKAPGSWFWLWICCHHLSAYLSPSKFRHCRLLLPALQPESSAARTAHQCNVWYPPASTNKGYHTVSALGDRIKLLRDSHHCSIYDR